MDTMNGIQCKDDTICERVIAHINPKEELIDPDISKTITILQLGLPNFLTPSPSYLEVSPILTYYSFKFVRGSIQIADALKAVNNSVSFFSPKL